MSWHVTNALILKWKGKGFGRGLSSWAFDFGHMDYPWTCTFNMDLKLLKIKPNRCCEDIKYCSVILPIWRWWDGANFTCLSLCGTKNRNDTLLISNSLLKTGAFKTSFSHKTAESREAVCYCRPVLVHLATKKWKPPLVMGSFLNIKTTIYLKLTLDPQNGLCTMTSLTFSDFIRVRKKQAIVW